MTDLTRRQAFQLTAAAASPTTAQPPAPPTLQQHYLDPKRGRNAFHLDPSVKRPHIFLLTADMVSPDHYHPSRTLHQSMHLPALQSLQRDSVVFDNAFCASPLCAPARAALFTGRYTYITANGERSHDGHLTTLRDDDVIFPEYLKAAGYTSKHAGKGHVGVTKFVDAFDENSAAWDRWAPPIESDEYYRAYLRGLGVKPQRYAREIRGLQQDRSTPANSVGGWIEQADGRPFPLEASYSLFLADQALTKLSAALDLNQGPAYLQLDLFDPHQPFTIPAGFDDRARALSSACSALPRSYHDVARSNWSPQPHQPRIYDLYRRYWGLYNPQTVTDYRVANALQMEVVDHALARFLNELKRRGIYDESVIIFTADHGEMNGRRALIDKGVYLHPDVLRAPLYLKLPASHAVAPRRVEAPVSHLDIAPTLLQLAGLRPQCRLDGQSLLPLAHGQPPADRELLFECGTHVGVNFACATQSWSPHGPHHLYVYNACSEIDELYDLRDPDPPNLAAQPALAEARVRLIQRLGAQLARDPRWLMYWSSFRLDHYQHLPKALSGDMQIRAL